MSRLEKYPKYKDSGVEWIGEIPEGWEIRKLKFLGKIYAGLTDKKGNDFSKHQEKDLKPFIPFTNIFNNVVISENEFQYVKIGESEKQNIVQKGDLLFLMSSETLEDIGKTALYDGTTEVFLNSFCKGFNVNQNKIDSYYLNWLLQSNGYRTYFSIMGRGFTRINIKQDYVNSLFALLPPKQEQTKIANYLNEKTAQIDKAITLKEQLIERLKERKQVLINDAVTKGLDPNVKMKDSGVEWIGEIPEGWRVEKFRFLFNFSKGLNITKENLQEEGIPCVNYGEIHSKYGFELDPARHPLKYVSEDYLETSKKSLLQKGDFVFADTSEDVEAAGSFTYLNSEIPTFAGYHTIITRPKRTMVSRYIAYFMDSGAFRDQVRQRVKGVKVYSITNTILKETLICLPRLQEQQYIVEYLDAETQKIDQVISFQNKQIEKLKEYKATLIDSVVTGKVRVA